MSSPFTPPESALEIAPPSALERLWTDHRGALLGGIAGAVLLGLIVLGVTASRKASAIASRDALAAATDGAGWNKVLSSYPDSPAAADAMLLLAASLRDEGKLEESDSLYSRLAEAFPRSPIAVSALIGRASNARVAGKTSEALNDYQQAAAAYPQSYGAPFAILSQIRLLAQDGKSEDARRLLQALVLGGEGQHVRGFRFLATIAIEGGDLPIPHQAQPEAVGGGLQRRGHVLRQLPQPATEQPVPGLGPLQRIGPGAGGLPQRCRQLWIRLKGQVQVGQHVGQLGGRHSFSPRAAGAAPARPPG